MKKVRNIILIFVLIFLVGLFIHPKKVIYAPKIIGQVVDQNGNPIQYATVVRIEKNEIENKEFGYYEHKQFKSQIIKTGINGDFVLTEKSKIDWLHTPIDLPFVWCYANFEVSKEGYETYKTEYNANKNSKFNDNQNACKDIEFNPRIVLKKL
ncbi:hypothetical protein [uncultured Algibacter sp.]|uniref:hypothetical protein n=1 Tax=uncultured Algibacter sp. TaxID=298659 RepID=UPI002603E3A9|nr:hypothetical protein [uncultured Algibacter sp.]